LLFKRTDSDEKFRVARWIHFGLWMDSKCPLWIFKHYNWTAL